MRSSCTCLLERVERGSTVWLSRRAALLDLIDEASRLTSSDSRAALEATALVLSLAEDRGDPLVRARACRARARSLAYAGDFQAALACCTDGIGRADDAGLGEESGRLRLALMHPLLELGRLDDAVDAGLKARAIFEDIGAAALSARADINLGAVYQRRDEPERAVDCLDRALPVLQDQPLMLGHLLNNRGEALLALNRFTEAEASFNDALTTFESEDAALTAAIAAGNLADLAVRQGRLASALSAFEIARQRLESVHAPAQLARLLAEQADAHATLGMHEQALNEYRTALRDLDRYGLSLEAARARAGMGEVLVRRGRFAEAETALAAAAIGFDELGHTTRRAIVDLLRAEVLSANARHEEARAMVMRALVSLDTRPIDAIHARHVLARIAGRTGDFTRADAELTSSIAVAHEYELTPFLADLLQSRAELRRDLGDLPGAIEDLQHAVSSIERVRGSLQADRFRSSFLGSRARTYELLIETLLDHPADEIVSRVLRAMEQSKARTMLDMLFRLLDGPATRSDGGGTSGSRSELADARRHLSALYSRLGDEALSRSTSLSAWKRAVKSREAQIAELETREMATRARASVAGRIASMEHIQRSIRSDESLIEYYTIGEEVLACVLRPDRVSIVRHLVTMPDLLQLIRRTRFQMNRALSLTDPTRTRRAADDATAELHELHARLLGPLRSWLDGVKRLIIVPHGPLHGLPFHALYDGQRFVIEQAEVQLCPSASILAFQRERTITRADGPALVVARTGHGLMKTDAEARIVHEHVGGRLLADEDATCANVLGAISGASIVHVACHGHFSTDAPMASGLRLADRWLTVQDIVSQNLQPALVTLSACDSGRSLIGAGDEAAGLVHAFLAAGAEAVLASLWRISDDAAPCFMNTLYARSTEVHDGRVDWCRAVADAMRESIREGIHPAHWAPFVLTSGA